MDNRRWRSEEASPAVAASSLSWVLALAWLATACNHDKLSRDEARVESKSAADRDLAARQGAGGKDPEVHKDALDPAGHPNAKDPKGGSGPAQPVAGTGESKPTNPPGAATVTPPATGASTPEPCVASATEQCGPFPHEFVEWCLEKASGGSACRGNKWSKSLYEATVAQLRSHLSGQSQASAWTPCPALHLVKDKKVLLRSSAGYDEAPLLEVRSPTALVPLQQWGLWRKVRAGDKEGWTLAILVSCTPPM